MTKPIIVWEKWRDPYGNDDTSEIQETINRVIENENEDTIVDESNQDDTDLNINFGVAKHKIPMIITPMGLIPYTENTASSKIFNFWLGHSNFNITQNISDTIETIDGVETLDIFTRYRFRISIGKAFKDSDVMHEINTKVYSLIE